MVTEISLDATDLLANADQSSVPFAWTNHKEPQRRALRTRPKSERKQAETRMKSKMKSFLILLVAYLAQAQSSEVCMRYAPLQSVLSLMGGHFPWTGSCHCGFYWLWSDALREFLPAQLNEWSCSIYSFIRVCWLFIWASFVAHSVSATLRFSWGISLSLSGLIVVARKKSMCKEKTSPYFVHPFRYTLLRSSEASCYKLGVSPW